MKKLGIFSMTKGEIFLSELYNLTWFHHRFEEISLHWENACASFVGRKSGSKTERKETGYVFVVKSRTEYRFQWRCFRDIPTSKTPVTSVIWYVLIQIQKKVFLKKKKYLNFKSLSLEYFWTWKIEMNHFKIWMGFEILLKILWKTCDKNLALI